MSISTVLPPLQRYDLTKPPSTNVQDSGGLKPSSESVANSITDPLTESKDCLPTHDENDDKTILTDETDQLERKDTDSENSSDDDYKECDSDGSSEPVEIPYPSLNQTLSGKVGEPSLQKSLGDTTPQQSVTLPPLGTPKKTPDSK